jgi:5,5'-dehydrodivanillate O-demethylase
MATDVDRMTRQSGNNEERVGSDYRDFVHTGPRTLAGRFLRRFWQPIYRSDDLSTGKAKPVRVLGEDFTLYRGEDRLPYLVDFRCPHRGTQLSAGWVENDGIRCMFHGWKFNGRGQCVEQPAEPKPFLDKVKIRSMPVREYLGLVYAYLGDGEPPEFPRYPDLENFQGVVLAYPYYKRSCNYFQNIENGLDPAHQAFTHRSAVGSVIKPPKLRVEESGWGITARINFGDGDNVVYYFGMPNIQRIRILPTDPKISNKYQALIYKVPVDDWNHLQFMVIGIPTAPDTSLEEKERIKQQIIKGCKPHPELVPLILTGEMHIDDVNRESMLNQDLIWLQDDVVQDGQGAIVDRQQEHLGMSDVGIIMIRDIWEREMRALTEGREIKRWIYTPVSFEI